MSHYHDVVKFHIKFGLIIDTRPALLDEKTAMFRSMFMLEELSEFMQAQQKGDVPKALDALIDLVYVAYGTAIMMGISPECWATAWDEVQQANLKKERAPNAVYSKRGSSLDVVKPEGWQPPDIEEVLKIYGWVSQKRNSS